MHRSDGISELNRMTTQDARPDSSESQTGFRFLPWIAILIVAALYLFTLDRWFGQGNLSALSDINGWDWRPLTSQPLHYLITKPLALLPILSQPVALSLLSFVCGTLSLLLLARTVQILPQERTRLQRQRVLASSGVLPGRIAWLPATLAVLVCGLQYSFWALSKGYAPDSIDLLLFAYCVRALAEFRHSRNDSWLHKAALVYAMGMTSNFALIGYFPLFIGTVLWMKGRSFFDFGFLLKFGLLGCLGLLLYLIPAIAHATSDVSPLGFWEALRAYLGAQKFAVFSYRRVTALFLAIVCIFPLLGMAFRWGEAGGDVSGASAQVTTGLTHLVNAAFLILGLAAAFEYKGISVRELAAAAGTPAALTVFYLSALSVGYYTGYFLLVFGTPSIHKWGRPSPLGKGINRAVVALVAIASICVPAALIYVQWPKLSKSQGPALNQMARRMSEALPDGSISLSDSPFWFLVANAGTEAAGRGGKVLHTDSSSITSAAYHRYMRKRHPKVWPPLEREYSLKDSLAPGAVIRFLTSLSLSNQVLYTEPSFGYFFEAHYLEPAGMLYRLQPLPIDRLEAPPLKADSLARADAYWRTFESQDFPALIKSVPKKRSTPPSDVNASLARRAYSRTLNYWGVALERSGFKDQASAYFQHALDLNPANACAYVNKIYNAQIRTNGSIYVTFSDDIKKLFEEEVNRGLDGLLRANGPVDESGNLLVHSRYFAASENYMQSAQMLNQVASRDPAAGSEFQLAVAKLLNQAGRPDLALTSIARLRESAPRAFLSNATNALDVLETEGRALYTAGNFARAETLLKDAMTRFPSEDSPFSTLASLHLQHAAALRRVGKTNEYLQQISNARSLLEKQVMFQPTNANAWVNYGAAYMRADMHSEAIAPLNKAIQLDPGNHAALQNRAICHFRLNQLSEAQKDYERLRSLGPETPYAVYYGLAEIAARTGRNKDARKLYEEFIKNSPNAPEEGLVRDRLKSLK